MNLETMIELNRAQEVSEHDSFTSQRYIQFMEHFHGSTTDVLDLGCNTGRGGALMKSRAPHLRITGVDCVPERIAALDKQSYVCGVIGTADAIPLPSNSFDAIVAGEVIEHLTPPDVVPCLYECWRLLRLRGRLLLTTPNPHYLKNKLCDASVLLEPSHMSQHSPNSLRRRLEDAGFSRIRVYGSGRVSSWISQHCPILSLYGSYSIVGQKW